MQNNNNQHRIRVNHQIRIPQVRVILEDGSSPGIIATKDALKLAQDAGLDLIEINPKAIPPVCKIVDYGKYKYDEKKKITEAKRTQKVQELKELTFRPNTDQNDLNHKLEQAKEFLTEGHKVKFTIRFRGREVTHPEVGRSKIEWLLKELIGLIQLAPPINMEGKFMSALVNPTRKQ